MTGAEAGAAQIRRERSREKMSRIRIDFDGLEQTITRMNGNIETFEGLNSSLKSMTEGIKAGWEGQAAQAFASMMGKYESQAGEMTSVLEAFKQYAGGVRSEFMSLDAECAKMIRNAF